MSNSEFGSFTLLLVLMVGTAHLFGYIFSRLRQPRVVGEILAGVLLGPALLGRFAPHFASALFGRASSGTPSEVVLGFLYNLGLLLLMFSSGAETKGLFDRRNRREVAWLGLVGTGMPFLITLLVAPLMPLGLLIGSTNQRTPLLLVICIAMAVTSIPVISRILHDLNILHTRFARLILGVAVIEDIVLWGVLAVAMSLAKAGGIPKQQIAAHIASSLIYFGIGLMVMPALLRTITNARWNPLPKASPIGYAIVILLAYSATAAIFDISPVFAAFLAGYAIVSKMEQLEEAVRTIGKVSFGIFIPVYFVMVGYRLDLTRSFSLAMVAIFLVASCGVKLLSAGVGARLAGFNWADSVNLSMALNARGGPGIVLASVAFDAHVINPAFYTTLVLVAILTSQIAGTWLEFVLRTGRQLLSSSPLEPSPLEPTIIDEGEELAA